MYSKIGLGVLLIIVGFLLQSLIFEFLLDVAGWLLIAIGVVALIIGIVDLVGVVFDNNCNFVNS